MKYWKLYTGAYIALLCVGLLTRLVHGEGVSILGAIIVWGSAIALVGLVRQKPFLKQWFWKIIAIVYALILGSAPILSAYMVFTSSENVAVALVLLGVVALFVPAVYGTYLYGFKSCYLWDVQSNQSLKSGTPKSGAP